MSEVKQELGRGRRMMNELRHILSLQVTHEKEILRNAPIVLKPNKRMFIL